ncbi:YeeE/YedE family protein [Halorussus gelatinilyticus]|uniref:YeeE/YedE family protein n=1 Tax=Halorussus gelatinilyticus TaxID=2937524 RepID=A0A8U0IHY9_9EURY|nr:YeeE/YedE family protein [Halorussus gelatinilyticus]UPV99893.1 YeeE/YedE family protein [Halorussus gelatinilyticus]
MVSQLLIAGLVGLGLGAFLQKGRFCFVHAFRDLFAFKDSRVTKAVLAATTLTMLFWSIAYELGYYQGFWTPGWGLTGLLGGFVFGVGMTYAGGCASGTLYRAGQGYLHFWLTLFAMGVGYVVFTLLFPTLQSVYFEPLTFGEGVSLFTVSPVPAPVLALLVTVGVVVVYSTVVGRERQRGTDADQTVAADGGHQVSAPAAGFQSLVAGTKEYLHGFTEIDDWVAASKRPWNPITAALGITVLAVLWFTQVSIVGVTGPEARWTGYLLERAGFDSGSYAYWGSVLFKGEGVRLTVDMVMIAAVIVGAFIAAYWSGDFSIRVPKRKRIPNAVGGGFLMGAGSRLAPGCNIGNIYSGLAELSVHSFVATIGIVAGVYVMTHWIYRDVGCAL